jgi:hypothetical protein
MSEQPLRFNQAVPNMPGVNDSRVRPGMDRVEFLLDGLTQAHHYGVDSFDSLGCFRCDC